MTFPSADQDRIHEGFQGAASRNECFGETQSGAKAGRIGRSLTATFLALVVMMPVGCTRVLKPPVSVAHTPNRTVPDSFGGLGDTRNSGLIPWRDFFVDAPLVALVDAALQQNQELKIAIQETVVANAEIMARRGEYLPKVGFGVDTGTERVGKFTSQGQSDELTGVGSNLPKYQPALYASWEIDVWGRLRNLAKAASHRYLASIEGRNFMVTRLVAEIAGSYYELLALDRQLRIITENIALQEKAVELARAQFEAGRATSVAPARFEATLRAMQSSKYKVQQRIVETENQLNFLAGRYPTPIKRSRANFLERKPAAMAVGVPAELLANRPDVRHPRRATFEVLDRRYVHVVDKSSVVHEREINVARELADIFVIKSGLTAGDNFVLDGARQVHQGERLERTETRPPQEAIKNLKFKAE